MYGTVNGIYFVSIVNGKLILYRLQKVVSMFRTSLFYITKFRLPLINQ